MIVYFTFLICTKSIWSLGFANTYTCKSETTKFVYVSTLNKKDDRMEIVAAVRNESRQHTQKKYCAGMQTEKPHLIECQ